MHDEFMNLNQIKKLLNRTVMMMELDILWDVEEKVVGNQWDQMQKEELINRLTEDFTTKLNDEYNEIKESEGK